MRKFTGNERDPESGLDYFGARYYDPVAGRFLSVDSLTDSAEPEKPQTWNRYSYVFNNPLVLVDPTDLLIGATASCQASSNSFLEARLPKKSSILAPILVELLCPIAVVFCSRLPSRASIFPRSFPCCEQPEDPQRRIRAALRKCRGGTLAWFGVEVVVFHTSRWRKREDFPLRHNRKDICLTYRLARGYSRPMFVESKNNCMATIRFGHPVILVFLTATLALPRSAGGVGNQWETLGPEGGAPWALRIDPNDSQRMFAASVSGIYRSLDGGDSWILLRPDNIRFESDFEVFFSAPAALYVSTLTATIERSLDGGLTWETLSVEAEDQAPHQAFDIAVDEVDPDRVYAATDHGFFESEDRGETWLLVPRTSTHIDRVVASPSRAHVVSIIINEQDIVHDVFGETSSFSIREFHGVRDIVIDPADPETLFIVHNAGILATRGTSIETTMEEIGVPRNGHFRLAVSPGQPDILYASTGTGVWRSPDRGASWTPVHRFGLSVRAIDPLDADVLFASLNDEFVRSRDGGRSFAILRGGLRNHYVADLAPDPGNPLSLLSAGNLGALKSVDAGRTWSSPARGRSNITADPADPDRMLSLGAVEVLESRDAGRSFFESFDPAPGFGRRMRALRFSPSNPNVAYLGVDATVFRTRNAGLTWDDRESVFTPAQPRIQDLAVAPRDPDTVYAAFLGGVYRSRDAAAEFERVLPDPPSPIFALRVDPSHAQRLYALGREFLMRSDDLGDTWSVAEGLPRDRVRELAFDGGNVYAALEQEGLYVSRDGGATFSAFLPGVPIAELNAVAILEEPRKALLAGSDGGIHRLFLDQPAPASRLGPGAFRVERSVSSLGVVGATATWTVTLLAEAGSELEDGPADEYVETLPPDLQLLSASSDSGRLRFEGAGRVAWNGSLLQGRAVTITLQTRIRESAAGLALGAQGALRIDRDQDGEAELWILSDDPSTPDSPDSTILEIETAPQEVFVAPRRLREENTFVGLAVGNSFNLPTSLRIQEWSEAGQLLADRVQAEPLPEKGQMAQTADEFADSGESATLAFQGVERRLDAFFLLGDNASRRLDGVGGPQRDGQHLFFAEVRENAQSSTHIFLFNKDAQKTANATLALMGADGIKIAESQVALPPRASLQETVSGIFGEGLDDGYVEVAADRPLTGFQLVATPETFTTLPAQFASLRGGFWVPHYFFDANGGTTEVRLVNPWRRTLRAVLAAIGDGEAGRAEAVFEVAPGHVRTIDVREVAGADASASGAGYLEIRAEDAACHSGGLSGVIAAVTYDGGSAGTRASLALPVERNLRPAFLQVAQAPDLGIFQGVAAAAPFAARTMLDVSSKDPAGQTTAFDRTLLDFQSRLIGLLSDEAFASLEGGFGPDFRQVGGTLEADNPGGAFLITLFGGPRFLSAIQATPR